MVVSETLPVPMKADAHGTILIGGTRVTLETVIAAFRDGCSAEEIVLEYPALRLADVYLTIAYCLDHQADVDDYVRERDELAAAVRQEIEARSGDMSGIRDRLMARRAQMRGGQ
jgi:uncharacterized protein (DUF433 family)